MARLYHLLFPLFVLGFPSAALRAGDLDLAALKRDTQVFERIVHEIIQQNFANPFALTAEPEGTYLEGYGVVVFFHLNINRARIRTPFGEFPARGETPRPKQEQLKVLRESMIRCLAEYGSSFRQLPAQEQIAITAHVEDRNELDPTRRVTVAVVSASKESVDLFASQKISFDTFQERVVIREY